MFYRDALDVSTTRGEGNQLGGRTARRIPRMIRGQLQMKATSLGAGATCQSAAGEPKQQNGAQIGNEW